LSNGVGQRDVENTMQDIKEIVFDDLESSEIRGEYYDYLRGVVLLVREL
jgi:hypothetical protein